MALHLLSLIRLTGPGWVMGIISDNGSAEGYAQEMYSTMWNFGDHKNDRLGDDGCDCRRFYGPCSAPRGPRSQRLDPSCDLFCLAVDNDCRRPISRCRYFSMRMKSPTHTSASLSLLVAFLGSWTSCATTTRKYMFSALSLCSVCSKKNHIALKDLIATPGSQFFLAQLLSCASASDSMDISCIWSITEKVLGTNRPFLHEIANSGLLSNIAVRCARPSDDYDVAGAATAVTSFFVAAYSACAVNQYAPNIVNAAVALCEMLEHALGPVLLMVCRFCDCFASSIAGHYSIRLICLHSMLAPLLCLMTTNMWKTACCHCGTSCGSSIGWTCNPITPI
ncbi:hypothetical protein BC828DRAFT_16579 [Blastocladiella britannica]|nr:hypothetical protein BC828DRAFT_16579 [Blastocladiella britannica]